MFDRNFYLLFSGQFVSMMGTSIYSVTIVLFLKELTGSGTVIGMMEMLVLLPGLLLGPFSGTIVDLFDRKRIIVRADLVCGSAMVLLSIPGLLGYLGRFSVGGIDFNFQGLGIRIWMVMVATVVVSLAYSMFRPAVDASIPDMVPAERLKKANSLLQSSVYFTYMCGVALAGVLFGIVGVAVLVLLNGLSYIASAVAEAFLKIPKRQVQAEEARGARAYLDKTKEGLRYIWGFRGLRGMLLVFMFTNALFPPVIVSLPFFIEDTLGLPPRYYGYTLAIYVMGGMLGYIGYGALKASRKTNTFVFLGAFFVAAMMILLVSFASFPPLIFGLFAVVSASVAVINLLAQTVTQKVVPSEMRGRVFATNITIATAAMPLSFAVSGVLFDLLGKNPRIMFAGVSAVCLVIACYLLSNRDVRTMMLEKS